MKKGIGYYEEVRIPKKEGETIVFRSFVEEDLKEAAIMIARNQIRSHPVFVSLEWDFDRCFQFNFEFLPHLLKDEMSIVGVYKGKILAFAGAYDYCHPPLTSFYAKFPDYLKTRGLDNYMSTLPDFKRPNNPNEVISARSLVVDEAIRDLKIGQLITIALLNHPKIKTYKKILFSTASNHSKRILNSVGAKTAGSVKYIDIVNKDGSKPFQGIYEKLEKCGISKDNDVVHFVFYDIVYPRL